MSAGGLTLASMFESGDFGAGIIDGNSCVAGLLAVAGRDRHQENLCRVRVVESVCNVVEIRLADADDRGGDPSDALRDAVCEAAGALRMSWRQIRAFTDTGFELDRLPLTAIRFSCGMLDWSHVTVMTSVLGYASDETIKAIESDAVAAAARFNAPSLRKKLWRLWMTHNPDEAAVARALSARTGRKVSVRQEGDGTAILHAQLTDLEGAEADALIEEIAGTVCKSDPRSLRQLRVDGLLALLHSEEVLECHCDRGEQCPVFGITDAPPPRRGHLVQILVDVQTLLGLTSSPAVLADGTPLDADLARLVAKDTQWQALLTELVTVLTSSGVAVPGGGDIRRPAALLSNSTVGQSLSEHLIGRGRVRRGGIVPRAFPRTFGPARSEISESVRAKFSAELLATIENNPILAAGLFPDGHGGLTCPPPGALTYKPSTETAAHVRMRHRTCTFEHCDVPSTKCELDHIVPFDHRDPERGGWTIETNLHPVCTCHHQVKTSRSWTVALLQGCAILWTSRSGHRRISLPDPGVLGLPRARRRGKRGSEPEPDPVTVTWWEKNQSPGTQPPTTKDLRDAATDVARARIRNLRRRFREHGAVVRLRERAEPPPF